MVDSELREFLLAGFDEIPHTHLNVKPKESVADLVHCPRSESLPLNRV